MRMLALLFVCVFSFVGCTKDSAKEVLCDTGKAASSLVASQVAVQLDCKNLDAVKADIDKKLLDLKICEIPKSQPAALSAQGVSTKSVLSNAICAPVIDGLLGGLLTQIPANWECTGGKPAADLRAKLLESCSKAF